MLSHKFPALLILDCDGVLIDSEIIATDVHIEALAKFGYSISVDDYNSRFIGVTDQQAYAIIESETGRRLPDDYHHEAMAEISRRYASDLKAITGIHQALETITLPKCVASSSNPEKLRLGLDVTNLYDCFAPYVFSASQVARGKPAPDLFLFAAEEMKTPAAQCLVIEDSIAGVQAAIAANMPVIGFVGGSHCAAGHASKLLEAGALMTFSDMKMLPDILSAAESELKDQAAE